MEATYRIGMSKWNGKKIVTSYLPKMYPLRTAMEIVETQNEVEKARIPTSRATYFLSKKNEKRDVSILFEVQARH